MRIPICFLKIRTLSGVSCLTEDCLEQSKVPWKSNNHCIDGRQLVLSMLFEDNNREARSGLVSGYHMSVTTAATSLEKGHLTDLEPGQYPG